MEKHQYVLAFLQFWYIDWIQEAEEQFLLTRGLMMASAVLVNTGLGSGLLPDITKPLPEPVLPHHQRDPLAFIPG